MQLKQFLELMNSGQTVKANSEAHLFMHMAAQEALRLTTELKNIHIGKNVFINACCCFQDQGGITLGDGVLVGHRVTLATLNHGETAEHRGDLTPAPIVIGENAWLGANVTVVPGVTIGAGAIVAAGAVVTRDVPPLTVMGGIPARALRKVRA